ncbi:galactosyltransferase-related protein [Campylobacter sp. MIT 21-1685]|uniref:galactosyltransferase-related protein n=1 Tax=unclassified Campylobacter TaxID=2593542 RepID=UPI00224AD51D|nr:MULTISPECIES: galactosyltransferase-related protein [unclassified Campylobacter]MCX2683663.1 galactosyltransferase-related protein [Campylobacter sp. MIT 21-1684]MCX2751935.1 galactosyltransferase-related protein [Campylobacter sp. MIT 21-1682]MCX2808136.1 galactosyltransferase-related protein [Campylobacter sp. MIT 21-1685]
MMQYSVIIPIDLDLRPIDILKKVKSILKRSSDKVEIVFGHNDRGSIFDYYLKKIIQKKPNVKLASGKFYTRLISQALLRNRAVEQCTCEYIYLVDVDYLYDEALSDLCIAELKSHKKPFIILPCIYLSQKGSRYVFKQSREQMFDKFIDFRKDLFLSLASPSGGAIFMKRKDYFTIGGFDEDFIGRGGEDFEFMIKLALFHKAILPSQDLMINQFYKAPLLCEGFRKYLSVLCLPYFFEKKVAFHLYHGRNRLRGYFRQYAKNSQLLQEKIQLDTTNISKGDSLLQLYEQLCEKHQIPISKYAVLFDSYKPKIFSVESFLLFLRRL